MENEKFDIKALELEFKYDGSNVKLSKFDEFAKSLNPQFRIEVSSWDIYYAPTKSNTLPFEFMRLRLGPKPELTIKVKLDEKNNNNRIEVDLPLDKDSSQESLEYAANKYCEQFGFEENFRIFKYCSIYFFEKTDLVYYVVSNEEMKEIGRFIEVESRKDATFSNAEEAWSLVKDLEQKLSVFGITPQNRTKLSQWERNKRSNKS